MLLVRQGKLTDNLSYSLQDLEFPDEEIVGSLLTQFYQGQRFIPDEILLPVASGRPRSARRVSEPSARASGSRFSRRSAATSAIWSDGGRERQAKFRRAARSGEGAREDAARAANALALEALSAAHRVLRYLDDPRRQRGRFDGHVHQRRAGQESLPPFSHSHDRSVRPAATISA